MDTYLTFQDVITVKLGASGQVIQSRADHLDLGAFGKVMVHVEVWNISAGNLYLDTAASEEGPWFVVENWDAAADETIQLGTFATAGNKLARFLRWRFAHTAAATVTFRLRYHVEA